MRSNLESVVAWVYRHSPNSSLILGFPGLYPHAWPSCHPRCLVTFGRQAVVSVRIVLNAGRDLVSLTSIGYY